MKILLLTLFLSLVSGCPGLNPFNYGENESCSFPVTIHHVTDESVEKITCECSDDKACKRAIIKGCMDYTCHIVGSTSVNLDICPTHGLTSSDQRSVDGLSETCLEGREVEELCNAEEEVTPYGCSPIVSSHTE